MTQKLTTRDLLGALIDLEEEAQYVQSDEEDQIIQSHIVEVKKEISRKVEGIDFYAVEMNRQTGLIDAEIKTMSDEVKRLRTKKAAIKKTEDYFNQVLLPMIIDTAGNDGVFKTQTSRYKLYETWGPLEVTDEDSVPDEYKRAKIEVDKRGARKAVIEAAENNMGISGFAINKVKRVRRT